MESFKPITFVSGKGGVGKSLVAAGLALQCAQRGQKTLLVELGETSFYSKFFGVDSLKEPVCLKKNLYVHTLSAQRSLHHYITHFVKVKTLVDLFFETKAMKALIKAAPALKELALLGQITSRVRHHGPELDFEHIIVDSYATGHFLALLMAPFGIYEAIKIGPMGEQCLSLQKALRDPSVTAFKIVSLPEEAPVTETLELCHQIKAYFSVWPDVICNKCLETPGLEGLELKTPFSQYLHKKTTEEKVCIEKLKEESKNMIKIPFIFKEDNWTLVETIAQRLEHQ